MSQFHDNESRGYNLERQSMVNVKFRIIFLKKLSSPILRNYEIFLYLTLQYIPYKFTLYLINLRYL